MKMYLDYKEARQPARKKVLPGLGGVGKSYLRKSKILIATLGFLAGLLESLGEKNNLEMKKGKF